MSKDQQLNQIIDYLENSYSRAKMSGDVDSMFRISRAILALKVPIEMNVFSEDAENWYIGQECAVS